MTDTTHDDLVTQACEWRENGSPPEPFYAVGYLIDAMADRIEELEAKLAKALRALERIEVSTDTREQGAIATATLAELKGQSE